MKNRLFLTALLGITLSLAFTSCKKDEDELSLKYKSQGFFKGKIIGVSKDGSYSFNDDFSYSHYGIDGDDGSSYTVSKDGQYSFDLKSYDFNNGGGIRFEFVLENAAVTSPELNYFSFFYTKELSDKIVEFSMNANDDNDVVISEFSFNQTTGEVKGKFSISGPANSTTKSASISGDFNVIAKKIVK